MNIFGAFTFGSLIKTFLPGFAWLIAIGMLEADFSRLVGATPMIIPFAMENEQTALVLAIPVSILLGLLSNIVVFMGVNDWLVRNPVRRAYPNIFALYDHVASQILDQCWKSVEIPKSDLRASFDRYADAEIILLSAIDVDKLAYVREQYWYFLEFQINLLFSIIAIFLASVVSSASQGCSVQAFFYQFLKYLVLCGPVCVLLYASARKNYLRHVSKMLSLMVAFIGPRTTPSTSVAESNGTGGTVVASS